VGSHRCRIKDSNNKSHSFAKTALLTSDTSLNIWLALNTVIFFLLVGLFHTDMFREHVLTNKINDFIENSLESSSQTQVNF